MVQIADANTKATTVSSVISATASVLDVGETFVGTSCVIDVRLSNWGTCSAHTSRFLMTRVVHGTMAAATARQILQHPSKWLRSRAPTPSRFASVFRDCPVS